MAFTPRGSRMVLTPSTPRASSGGSQGLAAVVASGRELGLLDAPPPSIGDAAEQKEWQLHMTDPLVEGHPEVKRDGTSTFSVEMASAQPVRRLHTRQSSTFNRRQKKLKIRPDVLVLLVGCADKLNAAQAQLEYRKALKRQATSLKQKGHAFEADVLQDIVEGRVPKELDALAEAERQVADQALQAVENGARRAVARLPTMYRDIQARVKDIMANKSPEQKWGYFAQLQNYSAGGAARSVQWGAAASPRSSFQPETPKVDEEDEPLDDVTALQMLLSPRNPVDRGPRVQYGKALTTRRRLEMMPDDETWYTIIQKRKKQMRYTRMLDMARRQLVNRQREYAARVIQRAWRGWKNSRFMRASDELDMLRAEINRRKQIEHTLRFAAEAAWKASGPSRRSFKRVASKSGKLGFGSRVYSRHASRADSERPHSAASSHHLGDESSRGSNTSRPSPNGVAFGRSASRAASIVIGRSLSRKADGSRSSSRVGFTEEGGSGRLGGGGLGRSKSRLSHSGNLAHGLPGAGPPISKSSRLGATSRKVVRYTDETGEETGQQQQPQQQTGDTSGTGGEEAAADDSAGTLPPRDPGPLARWRPQMAVSFWDKVERMLGGAWRINMDGHHVGQLDPGHPLLRGQGPPPLPEGEELRELTEEERIARALQRSRREEEQGSGSLTSSGALRLPQAPPGTPATLLTGAGGDEEESSLVQGSTQQGEEGDDSSTSSYDTVSESELEGASHGTQTAAAEAAAKAKAQAEAEAARKQKQEQHHHSRTSTPTPPPFRTGMPHPGSACGVGGGSHKPRVSSPPKSAKSTSKAPAGAPWDHLRLDLEPGVPILREGEAPEWPDTITPPPTPVSGVPGHRAPSPQQQAAMSGAAAEYMQQNGSVFGMGGVHMTVGEMGPRAAGGTGTEGTAASDLEPKPTIQWIHGHPHAPAPGIDGYTLQGTGSGWSSRSMLRRMTSRLYPQGYSSAGDMRALDSDDDHEGAGTMGGPGTAQQQPMVVSPLPARSPSPLLSPSNLDGTPFVPAPGAGVGSAAQLLNAQLQGLVGPEVLELVGAAPQHARYGALAREYADDLRLLNPPRPLFAGKGDAAAAAFLGLAGRYGRGGTACDAAGTDAPGDSSAWGLEIEGPEGHSQGQPGDDSQQGEGGGRGGAASSLSSPAACTELEAALERLGYGSSSGAGAGAEGCHHLYGLDGLRLDADEDMFDLVYGLSRITPAPPPTPVTGARPRYLTMALYAVDAAQQGRRVRPERRGPWLSSRPLPAAAAWRLDDTPVQGSVAQAGGMFGVGQGLQGMGFRRAPGPGYQGPQNSAGGVRGREGPQAGSHAIEDPATNSQECRKPFGLFGLGGGSAAVSFKVRSRTQLTGVVMPRGRRGAQGPRSVTLGITELPEDASGGLLPHGRAGGGARAQGSHSEGVSSTSDPALPHYMQPLRREVKGKRGIQRRLRAANKGMIVRSRSSRARILPTAMESSAHRLLLEAQWEVERLERRAKALAPKAEAEALAEALTTRPPLTTWEGPPELGPLAVQVRRLSRPDLALPLLEEDASAGRLSAGYLALAERYPVLLDTSSRKQSAGGASVLSMTPRELSTRGSARTGGGFGNPTPPRTPPSPNMFSRTSMQGAALSQTSLSGAAVPLASSPPGAGGLSADEVAWTPRRRVSGVAGGSQSGGGNTVSASQLGIGRLPAEPTAPAPSGTPPPPSPRLHQHQHPQSPAPGQQPPPASPSRPQWTAPVYQAPPAPPHRPAPTQAAATGERRPPSPSPLTAHGLKPRVHTGAGDDTVQETAGSLPATSPPSSSSQVPSITLLPTALASPRTTRLMNHHQHQHNPVLVSHASGPVGGPLRGHHLGGQRSPPRKPTRPASPQQPQLDGLVMQGHHLRAPLGGGSNAAQSGAEKPIGVEALQQANYPAEAHNCAARPSASSPFAVLGSSGQGGARESGNSSASSSSNSRQSNGWAAGVGSKSGRFSLDGTLSRSRVAAAVSSPSPAPEAAGLPVYGRQRQPSPMMMRARRMSDSAQALGSSGALGPHGHPAPTSHPRIAEFLNSITNKPFHSGFTRVVVPGSSSPTPLWSPASHVLEGRSEPSVTASDLASGGSAFTSIPALPPISGRQSGTLASPIKARERSAGHGAGSNNSNASASSSARQHGVSALTGAHAGAPKVVTRVLLE